MFIEIEEENEKKLKNLNEENTYLL